MRINVFEGARRIAKLAAVLWLVGVAVYAATLRTPTIQLRFDVMSPDTQPVASSSRCGEFDRLQTRRFQNPSGTVVSAEYCFRAQKSTHGDYAIPLQVNADKTWRGAIATSDAAKEYATLAASRFQLSYGDQQRADDEVRDGITGAVLKAGAAIVLGWLVLWVFTKAAGWIVRGVMGIPSGADYRPAALSPPKA
ncbi:MAG: hypothetical protein K1X51_17310 [Rhodospirillaceae bacterium]|nr:hypothetical protein [Rhodospirillaceae bacterium]